MNTKSVSVGADTLFFSPKQLSCFWLPIRESQCLRCKTGWFEGIIKNKE